MGVDDAMRDTCEDSIEKDHAERYTWGTKTIVALGVEGSGFFNKNISLIPTVRGEIESEMRERLQQ